MTNCPRLSGIDDYHPGIDGLRAIAVVAVILHHFFEGCLPSGFLGVDLFFVISGFVISASLLKKSSAKPLDRFLNFYVRRAKRILPALFLVVAVGSVSICLFSPVPSIYLKTGLFSFAGLSNIFLYFKTIDYWGLNAGVNPFTHTWSLGVEEQFYFLYPLIFIFFTSRDVSKRNLRNLATLIACLAGASLCGFIYLSAEHPAATYFLMPFRFWELGLGCFVYLALKISPKQVILLLIQLPAGLILGLLVAGFFVPREWGLFGAVLAPFIGALLIACLVANNISTAIPGEKFLERPAMRYLGKISYSLYLWHWVVLVIARWTIGITAFTAPVLVLGILGLSIVTYRFVETPLRGAKWFWSPRAMRILAPIGLGVIFSGLLAQWIVSPRLLFLGQPTTTVDRMVAELKPIAKEVQCHRIRAVGNSHAGHLVPMLEVIGQANRIEIIYNKQPNYTYIPSGSFRDLPKLDGVIAELNRGDLLILSSRNHLLYNDAFRTGVGGIVVKNDSGIADLGQRLKNWFEELDVVIASAEKKGINIVLFLPLPEFNKRIPAYPELYKKEWFRPEGIYQIPEASAELLASRFPATFLPEIQSRVRAHACFYAFNPMPYFRSDDGSYRMVVGDVVAFSDLHHLSPEGALLLLKPFYAFLQEHNLL